MKLRRISGFQKQICFSDLDSNFEAHLSSFYKTDLGKIYKALPWDDLVKVFALKDHNKGPSCIFSPRGKIALMFLKHYGCCSDRKLIEQLNANIHYQIFCDIVIPPGCGITNFKIVSQLRCELASDLDIASIQEVLAGYWRKYCNNKDSVVCDATCYESYLRYPTDVKLLYEAVVWNYDWLKRLNRQIGKSTLRSKIGKWKRRYGSYSKSKRPSKGQTRSIIRGLLRLLTKIDKALQEVECESYDFTLVAHYWQRRMATSKIIKQQRLKFYEDKKPENRIVSLDRPYIGPIVRGKEIKKVEFGAKVHKLQVGGISFIEHLSFDAFNEGSRLKQTIYTAQQLMHTKVKIIGADAIYATNENRKFVSRNNIKTDFKRKGKPSKHHHHFNVLARMITKERASAMEGSFGTDKEHFLLNKIKARTQTTETLWIFFGIHTANALKIGRRMTLFKQKAA